MALVIRKTSPTHSKLGTLINGIRGAVGSATKFHLDAYETTVTAADAGATELAKGITLANQIRAIYNFHVSDTVAHAGTDADEATAVAKASDQTTLIALVLDLAAQYELHRVETAGPVHLNADSTNTLTSTTVTTLAQACAVATDLKAKLNAHMANALAGQSARVVTG